jgi:hypothetical protein
VEVQPLPWAENMELFPGAVYTGFLDRTGRPAGLGCLRYASLQAATWRGDRALDVCVLPAARPGARWQHPAMFQLRGAAALPSCVTWASPPRRQPVRVPFAVYTGQFRNGRRHGLGFMSLDNGVVRAGLFVEDEQHGAGVEYRPDGCVYYGRFVRNEWSGPGLLLTPHGPGRYMTLEGQWADSRPAGVVVQGWLSEPFARYSIARQHFRVQEGDLLRAQEPFDAAFTRHSATATAARAAWDDAGDAWGAAVAAVHIYQRLAHKARAGRTAPGAPPAAARGQHIAGSWWADARSAPQRAALAPFPLARALVEEWVQVTCEGSFTPLLAAHVTQSMEFLIDGPAEAQAKQHLRAPALPPAFAPPGAPAAPAPVAVQLTLAEEWERVAGDAARRLYLCRVLTRDVANALSVQLDRVSVDALSERAQGREVLVALSLLPDPFGDGPSPLELSKLLAHQANFPTSSLRQAPSTRHATAARAVPSGGKRPGTLIAHAPAASAPERAGTAPPSQHGWRPSALSPEAGARSPPLMTHPTRLVSSERGWSVEGWGVEAADVASRLLKGRRGNHFTVSSGTRFGSLDHGTSPLSAAGGRVTHFMQHSSANSPHTSPLAAASMRSRKADVDGFAHALPPPKSAGKSPAFSPYVGADARAMPAVSPLLASARAGGVSAESEEILDAVRQKRDRLRALLAGGGASAAGTPRAERRAPAPRARPDSVPALSLHVEPLKGRGGPDPPPPPAGFSPLTAVGAIVEASGLSGADEAPLSPGVFYKRRGTLRSASPARSLPDRVPSPAGGAAPPGGAARALSSPEAPEPPAPPSPAHLATPAPGTVAWSPDSGSVAAASLEPLSLDPSSLEPRPSAGDRSDVSGSAGEVSGDAAGGVAPSAWQSRVLARASPEPHAHPDAPHEPATRRDAAAAGGGRAGLPPPGRTGAGPLLLPLLPALDDSLEPDDLGALDRSAPAAAEWERPAFGHWGGAAPGDAGAHAVQRARSAAGSSVGAGSLVLPRALRLPCRLRAEAAR